MGAVVAFPPSSSIGPTQVAASHEQKGKTQIATVCSEPVEEEFFHGTGFSSLSSYAQNMAIAMKESPIQALRRNLQMRGLSDAGTRPHLIVKICSQHDSSSRCSNREGNGNSMSKGEE